MGSGASKKSDGNAANFDDSEEPAEEDFDTFSRKKLAQKSQQPRLEQAGLLPKLQQDTPTNKNDSKTTRTIIG